MTAARPKQLSFVEPLGALFAALQGKPGIALETNCRIAPMAAPKASSGPLCLNCVKRNLTVPNGT